MYNLNDWVFPENSLIIAHNKLLEISDLDLEFYRFCKLVEKTTSSFIGYEEMKKIRFDKYDYSCLEFYDKPYSTEEVIILKWYKKLDILSGFKTLCYCYENGIFVKAKIIDFEDISY